MEIAQERYRNFFTRTVWGMLMIIVFGVILYTHHLLVSFFVLILQTLVFKEMIALRYIEAKEKNLPGFRTLHWYFLFITLFYTYGTTALEQTANLFSFAMIDLLHRYHLVVSFALYVSGFLGFVLTLRKGSYKYQFGQLTWTLMTLLLVVGQSSLIINNIFSGLFWFLLPCSLIICNDIMAYFCGFALGRKFFTKPLTSLSPNKTWEGFIGALLCTLVFSFFFSRFLAQYDWFICPYSPDWGTLVSHCEVSSDFIAVPHRLPDTIINVLQMVNYLSYRVNFQVGIEKVTVDIVPVQLHALVFALFASLIAPFGGFFASGIKRAYRVKDFDSLFPGHGGMTDRMDCQFIMGSFAYVYHSTFIKAGVLGVAQVMYHIHQLSQEEQRAILDHLQKTLHA